MSELVWAGVVQVEGGESEEKAAAEQRQGVEAPEPAKAAAGAWRGGGDGIARRGSSGAEERAWARERERVWVGFDPVSSWAQPKWLSPTQ